jgi:hypothetical protein
LRWIPPFKHPCHGISACLKGSIFVDARAAHITYWISQCTRNGSSTMLVAILKSVGREIWTTLVRTGERRAARAMANSKGGTYQY